MSKYNSATITNFFAILLCFGIVFGFWVFVKANPDAKVQFTADTILSLSGISDGDLYIVSGSECDEISISGSTLTVSDIPSGSSFILKTPQYNNALKITPSGGAIDLTFTSSHLSSGNITQWTLNGSGSTEVAHIIGVSKANTYYAIKADNVLFNSYQSDISGEVSFTYNGGFSSKTFTIEEDTTAPTVFDLASPVNNYSTFETKPTFSWNASQDPDLSHYQLYIDNSLDTNNITNISTVPTNALSCGEHTWYVKAVDKAGNSTKSNSTFNLNIACGSTPPWLLSSPQKESAQSEEETPEELIKSESINDGDLIRATNDYKVYIVKGNYKRHILDGKIFDFYGHLNWEAVKEVSPAQRDFYQESFLIRAKGDPKVYEINNDKTRHWLNMTPEEFTRSGRKWEMVYIVNDAEKDFYEEGDKVRRR